MSESHGAGRGIEGVGLNGRRFPFRARTIDEDSQVRDDINRLLSWLQPEIARYAGKRARQFRLNEADAEDLVSMVMIDLWFRQLPKFDRERGELMPYVWTCIVNRIVQGLRMITRAKSREEPHDDYIHSRRTLQTDLAKDIRLDSVALELLDGLELRAADAELLDRWRHSDATTNVELSREIGCRPETVSRKLRRIRAAILQAAAEALDAIG